MNPEPTVLLLPGDGVGQEVIPAAAEVLIALLPHVRLQQAEAGWACFQKHGSALPPQTLALAREADAILFGATQSPMGGAPGYSSPILTLRKELDLFANLRPARSLPGLSPRFDLLIVRENSEGLYSGRERPIEDGFVAERIVTARASRRIARVACEQALRLATRSGRRPHLTIVHKANVLKRSDGLFREQCLAVAAAYPDIRVDELLVDTAAMWLARDPGRFQVIVTSNLFGDILSDLAAGLAGGLGLAPSANIGDAQSALFEPVHGSAPDIAGRGVANPLAALRSVVMLLRHWQRDAEAANLEAAIERVLREGPHTPDLGGDATTEQVTHAVKTLALG
ncbi:MAG: isocitrate/isopropylmalate dehydrogenase family protein [Caldilineae bacterium]|nr:MAG: isocitrate/isopropylmalate dehydrogenase family protein [Caldilineae bacterium]